jgi:hypothetical protein
MRRLLLVPVLSLVAALGVATTAAANGGTYPSGAPTIVSGQAVNGGTTKVTGGAAGQTGREFYRITLGFGDVLTADFTTVTGDYTSVCVLDPGVTDFTVSKASCLQSSQTGGTRKAELVYTAPAAGSYLVDLRTCTSLCDSVSWAYTMVATVAHPSTVSASTAKTAIKAGRKIKIIGNVTPPGSTLTVQRSDHGWQTVGTVTANAAGAYKFVTKAPTRGIYKFRVLFGGGNGYLSSISSKVKVRAS